MTNRIGLVTLRVSDLDAQVAFYEEVIGLKTQQQTPDSALLGVGEAPLLKLVTQPGLVASHGQNGLYHFALLLPTRPDLARSLHHLLRMSVPLQGISDHAVSEAVYLQDPEGNGIEIYADRPRKAWFKNGEMQLSTFRADVEGILAEAAPPERDYQLPGGTIMGHVHLHVSNVAEAVTFYKDQLGMQVMFQFGSAAFLSYDGYHHHIGINTWAGRVRHAPNARGLDQFELAADANTQADALEDPSGNVIHLMGQGIRG